MKEVTTLGIDLAKQVFELHGLAADGSSVLKRRLRRKQLLAFMARLPACTVVMEACGGAQYWAREFGSLGHEARLMAAQSVKPYRQGQKNDANDAQAIAIAACAPGARFVAIKSQEQQVLQGLSRIRSRLVEQRTQLSNQARGLLAEFGIILPKGLATVRRALPKVIEDPRLPEELALIVSELHEELQQLDERINTYKRRLERLVSTQADGRRLLVQQGVGPMSAASLLAKLGDGRAYRDGRQFSASIGLVPRQHSSGETVRLGPITKQGDPELRRLLVHGARSVIRHLGDKRDRDSRWLRALVERRGKNRAAVALANKMARRAWALVRYGREYDPDYTPAAAPSGA